MGRLPTRAPFFPENTPPALATCRSKNSRPLKTALAPLRITPWPAPVAAESLPPVMQNPKRETSLPTAPVAGHLPDAEINEINAPHDGGRLDRGLHPCRSARRGDGSGRADARFMGPGEHEALAHGEALSHCVDSCCASLEQGSGGAPARSRGAGERRLWAARYEGRHGALRRRIPRAWGVHAAAA